MYPGLTFHLGILWLHCNFLRCFGSHTTFKHSCQQGCFSFRYMVLVFRRIFRIKDIYPLTCLRLSSFMPPKEAQITNCALHPTFCGFISLPPRRTMLKWIYGEYPHWPYTALYFFFLLFASSDVCARGLGEYLVQTGDLSPACITAQISTFSFKSHKVSFWAQLSLG